MGRTGIEPVTLGLKVLQIKHVPERKNAVSVLLGSRFSAGAERHLTMLTCSRINPRPRSVPTVAYLVGGERSQWCVGGVFTRRR
jgi:hypothetical protein